MQLLKLVKQAGVEAINTNKPMEVHIGTVTSINPLIITTGQKKPLTEEFLIVTENVRDYNTKALKLNLGEKLTLLKVQGGQDYVVLYRVVGA